MNKIEKDGTINHGKYKIVKFTANNKSFYQPRVRINTKWWYCEKFCKSIVEAGNIARKVIYCE